MIRINLHNGGVTASNSGFPWPKWFTDMLNNALSQFCMDYQISDTNVWRYINELDSSNKDAPRPDRLQKILDDYLNLKVSTYHFIGIPSWGIVIDETDPVVVEYKLKSLDAVLPS